jgi:hypothetical protein
MRRRSWFHDKTQELWRGRGKGRFLIERRFVKLVEPFLMRRAPLEDRAINQENRRSRFLVDVAVRTLTK